MTSWELEIDTDDDCGLTFKTRSNTAMLRILFEARGDEAIRKRLLTVLEGIEVVARHDTDDGKRKAADMRRLLTSLKKANAKLLREFSEGGNQCVTFKEIREQFYDFAFKER